MQCIKLLDTKITQIVSDTQPSNNKEPGYTPKEGLKKIKSLKKKYFVYIIQMIMQQNSLQYDDVMQPYQDKKKEKEKEKEKKSSAENWKLNTGGGNGNDSQVTRDEDSDENKDKCADK